MPLSVYWKLRAKQKQTCHTLKKKVSAAVRVGNDFECTKTNCVAPALDRVKDRYGVGVSVNKWLPKLACGKAFYMTESDRGLRAGFLSCKWFYKCDINLCYRWAKGWKGWDDRRGLSACHLSDFLTFDITFPSFPLRMPLWIWERGPGAWGKQGGRASRWAPYCSPLTTLCGAGSLLHCLPSKAHCSVANSIHFPVHHPSPRGGVQEDKGLQDYCCCRCQLHML